MKELQMPSSYAAIPAEEQIQIGGGFVRPHHSGHCSTDGGLMPTAPCV